MKVAYMVKMRALAHGFESVGEAVKKPHRVILAVNKQTKETDGLPISCALFDEVPRRAFRLQGRADHILSDCSILELVLERHQGLHYQAPVKP